MKRDFAIDCIKGFCMIWVVLSHNNASHHQLLIFDHPAIMGIFFVVSGYLIHTNLKIKLRTFLICKQFIVFTLFSILWRFGYQYISHESLDFKGWMNELINGKDWRLNIPMWFLLTYVQILFLIKVIHLIKSIYIKWTLVLVLMIVGIILNELNLNILYIGRTLQYISFFMLGQEIKSVRHNIPIVGKYPFFTMFSIVCLLWLRMVNYSFNSEYFRILIDSFMAIILTILLYNLFSHRLFQNKLLIYIGNHSLTILCVHILILDIVWRIWYSHFGLPDMYGAIIQTIIIFIFCWPLCELYDKHIKNKI